jgi:hypothetical protein
MSEYEANTENARGLQGLAGRADCCVVVLSQVSQMAQRLGSDDSVVGFKSSGAWAEVADLGLMLRKGEAKDQLVIAAPKNRHGPNEAAGSRADYRLDRTTGQVIPLDPLASATRKAERETAAIPTDWVK